MINLKDGLLIVAAFATIAGFFVSLLNWVIPFKEKISLKTRLIVLISCILIVAISIFSYFFFFPSIPSNTSKTPVSTILPIPSATTEGAPMIDYLSGFYICVNSAKATPDYFDCWKSQSIDYQNQFNGFTDFSNYWSQWKVYVELYYCDVNLIIAKEQFFQRTNTLIPSNPGHYKYHEYTFESNGADWKIISDIAVSGLRSTCAQNPILIVTPSP